VHCPVLCCTAARLYYLVLPALLTGTDALWRRFDWDDMLELLADERC